MLLLDTHTFIWLATSDKRLSARARALASEPDQPIYISVISSWEIQLRQRHPDFYLPEPFEKIVAGSSFTPLDLAFDTPMLLESLPSLHKDPFDRLLVAQALRHDLTILTRDPHIPRYPVKTIW